MFTLKLEFFFINNHAARFMLCFNYTEQKQNRPFICIQFTENLIFFKSVWGGIRWLITHMQQVNNSQCHKTYVQALTDQPHDYPVFVRHGVCVCVCVRLRLKSQSLQTGLSLTLVALERPPRCVCECVCGLQTCIVFCVIYPLQPVHLYC